MKRNKNVKIGAALLGLSLLLGIGCTVYNVYAKASWTESEIAEEYELLSEFSVPQREVTVSGETVKAQAVVLTPDGEVTKLDKVKLDTPGMYTVTYTAEADGKHYVEEETFLVHNKLYSFTSETSSAKWGKYEYAENTEGLMVRLASGDRMTFNEPIDLSAIKEGDNLISAFATPDSPGYADFEKLCFQFTDAEDPDVTLYISARGADWDTTLPYTYYQAAGNDQPSKGYESSRDKIHEEGNHGSVGMHSFGLGNDLCAEYCDKQAMNISVDFESMVVSNNQQMIIDLNAPEHFDIPWEGFSSGKVYLTVWAEIYRAQTANFCLFKAGDINLKRENKLVDTEPPVITIDTKYEETPTAVKGGRYQYIPTASAKDTSSGACEVTTKVYYNYQSPDASVLDASDGSFETELFGHYAIVYEATDAYGNLGREILWVKAEKTLQTPKITLKEKPSSKWVLGEKFVPAEYTYECYSGNPTLNVYATKGKKTYDLNDGYRFEKEGVYTITYELMDCAGQIDTYEYKLNVKVGDRPVLGEDIIMPEYMVEGSDYVFPKVYFNDYRSGKKERKVATGMIVDAEGEKKVKAGDTYKLAVDNNGDLVSIIFTCEDAFCEVKVPTVKVWGQENGRSAMLTENYFMGSGFTCEKGEGYTFKATAPDGGWSFANKLVAEKFSAQLQGVSGCENYETISLTMRDSLRAEECLSLEISPEGILSVKANGKLMATKKGIKLSSEGTLTIEYTDDFLYVAGAKIRKLDFDGFSSGCVYFSAQFTGAGDNAAFKLLSLNNHTFSTSRMDKIAPKMVIKGSYGGSHEYGEEIVLPVAVAGDVLNPNITFTMTVTDEEGAVKDVDGTLLENVNPSKVYTIKADKYGKYNVVYTAYESFSEKEETLSYVMHVTDDVAPTVEFKKKRIQEAEVGDVLCIPDYTLKDNITKAEELIVLKHVEEPSGKLLTLPEKSNSVTASKAGDYKFVILVIDAAGNVRNESWTVTVSEGK